MPSSLGLPPVVACRGVRPSQAARSRPRPKLAASPTAAVSAVALMTPIPGIVDRRRAASSARAIRTNSASKAAIRSSRLRHSARKSSIRKPHARRQPGIVLIGENPKHIFQLAPTLSNDDAALQQQCAQVIDQRRALRQARPRRCSAWMSDCASLFTGTNRIVGRVAASAIASASWSSFLFAFT